MTYQTPTFLKSRFEGGDIPTEQDFIDFIDSVHQEVVSVKAFGAKGDGSTDDITAFQNAASEISSGGTILIPPGDYRLSSLVELPDNSGIVGVGPASLITFTAAIDRGITNADRVSGNSRVYVANLRLDGADLCNDPIEFVNVTDGIIHNVWVTQGNHDGIELESCTRCIISDCITDNSNTFDGIELDSSVDCIVTGCLSHSNAQDGFNIGGTSDHNSVLSCYAFDNTRGGFLAAASTVRNTVFGYADSNTSANYSDSGTNNLFQVMGGDRFDFSVNDILTARLRSGEFHSRVPTSVPSSGNIPTSHIVWSVNEGGNQLIGTVKYSDGSTVRTFTGTLS